MTLLTLLLLLMNGFFTPSVVQPQPSPTCGTFCGPPGQIVSGPGYTGVIMPEAAADYLVYLSFAVHLQAWTPTAKDISQLEADWHAHLATTGNVGDADRGISADGYRQYAGFIRDHQHYVLVNSFCTKTVIEGIDWTRELVVVMDGGPCFYRVTYNVDTGEFSHLSVNGVA